MASGRTFERKIMMVLFLDIDGVLNYEAFWKRFRGAYGIDDELAARIRAIKKATKAKIVLSSAMARKPGKRTVYFQ